MQAAIARRLFPGGVLLLAHDDRLLHYAAYGTTRYADPGTQPVTRDTIYDLASVTKIVAATAALHLSDAGLLALDAPVQHYLPAVRARTVTVRHLLTHTSGLHVRMSALRDLPPADIRAAVYALHPAVPPGTTTAYVNVNTLLLGDVIAQVAGAPLDQVIRQTVLEPLQMHDTTFCPPAAWLPRIAPTEWDAAWRGGLVHGTVHDESAHALGGVAAHAGLFGTATDLWQFGRMWLHGGSLHGRQVLQPATVALATRYQAEWLTLSDAPADAIRCGLGWMLDRSAVMGDVPTGSYGHTGFTGAVLVVVPACRVVAVLLCNRTYPHRPAHREHFGVMAAVLAWACATSGHTAQ